MWISVNTRLPKTIDARLVTFLDMHGARHVTTACYGNGRWMIGMHATVIAWANMPRAYRGK